MCDNQIVEVAVAYLVSSNDSSWICERESTSSRAKKWLGQEWVPASFTFPIASARAPGMTSYIAGEGRP